MWILKRLKEFLLKLIYQDLNKLKWSNYHFGKVTSHEDKFTGNLTPRNKKQTPQISQPIVPDNTLIVSNPRDQMAINVATISTVFY